MSIPCTKNIPVLNVNYEGLKRHSHLCIFFTDKSLSKHELQLRSWFLHTVVASARQYTLARELVLKQELSDQVRDGGLILYVFDVSEHLENCISALYRVIYAIHKINPEDPMFKDFKANHEEAVKNLYSVRNQFEHMHSNIVSGQNGKGPIHVDFSDEGKNIQFRSSKIQTTDIHFLISELYRAAATFYPSFKVNSPPERGGPPILRVTMQLEQELPEKQT